MADDIIRTLTPAEVDLAVEWAAREGWNPGLADAPAFLAQDGAGFLGLFRDGALAACISAVLYGPGFGFLGFYICRPDLRGQGLGLKLWQAGMARFGDRTVGLDGVVAQQENYRKSGFVLAHRNIRFGGVPRPVAAEGPVRAVTAALVPAVIAYDATIFPAPRPDFLARWLAHPGGLALAAGDGGAVTGYGVIRRARDGWRIGPLFADTPAAGRALFAGLIAHAGQDHAGPAPIYMDVPEPHAAACALAQEAGLASCFDTARMYRGPDPGLPLGRIYGITSLELG